MKTVMKDHLIHLLSICILMSGYSVSASNFMQAQLVQGDMMVAERSDTLKTPLVNQKDKQGRRQGLWIERDGLREIYYRDGLKDGVAKTYFVKTGKLEVLGIEFGDFFRLGPWKYYNEEGKLIKEENHKAGN